MSNSVRFELVDPQSSAALDSMRAYFAELAERFPEGFDPGDTLDADADHFRPPQGRFIIARVDVAVAGCGGVQLLEPTVAEVKRMWVAPAFRGKGCGRELLEQLELVAADMGANTVRLDTNSVLVEAIAMYTARGYVDIPAYNENPYARRWFEKRIDGGAHPD